MTDLIDTPRAALRSLFPATPLDPTDAFAQWGVTYLDVESYVAGSRGQLWHALPGSFLEYHDDALSFLGPVAFAAILPAYLDALLDDELILGSIPFAILPALSRPKSGSDAALWRQRFDARMDHLDADQRRLVVRVLTAFIEKIKPKEARILEEQANTALTSFQTLLG